jgi:hypothetical protein
MFPPLGETLEAQGLHELEAMNLLVDKVNDRLSNFSAVERVGRYNGYYKLVAESRRIRKFAIDAEHQRRPNPYEHEGKWWFYDEADIEHGPYDDRVTAGIELNRYVEAYLGDYLGTRPT